MDKREPQKKATEIIKDLITFLDEAEGESDDIRTMPLSEITAELSEEGIDASSFTAMIKHKMSKIEAKEKLTEAHKKHAILLDLVRASGSNMVDSYNKTDFIKHLRKLVGASQKEALAYYRKFTKNNAADLKTLLDDLSLLDKLNSDNENQKS